MLAKEAGAAVIEAHEQHSPAEVIVFTENLRVFRGIVRYRPDHELTEPAGTAAELRDFVRLP
jgi:hypothetical protein